MEDKDNNVLLQAKVGGLIATGSNVKITNCFSRNLSINLKLTNSGGIGGIIGDFAGNIINCYSIGEIITNAPNIGGIFGISRNLDTYQANTCKNCYSCVNIKTESAYLGGIGAIADSTSIGSMNNNISIGNLYTSLGGANMNLFRILGNMPIDNSGNYGYRDQLINGFKISAENSPDAKTIVTREQMKNNNSNMFKNEIYEINDLKEEKLPRLKYLDTDVLLPNQEEAIAFPVNPTLEIQSVSSVGTDDNKKIKIDIKDENNPPVETYNINVQIKYFNDLKKSTASGYASDYNSDNQIHTIYLEGTPQYYLDSYEVSQVSYIYKENGKDVTRTQEIPVKFDFIQYKTINSADEWAKEFCPNHPNYNYVGENNKYLEGQNYKITSDINLSDIENITGSDGEKLTVPVNLEIGRLIYLNNNDSEAVATISYKNWKDAQGNTIESNSINFTENNAGLFKNITKELKNIKFEDIYIKNTSTIAKNNTGIIANTEAVMNNIKFSNIYIKADKIQTVGMIATSKCPEINSVELNNIKCIGNGYTGGFIGKKERGAVVGIVANNITVSTKSDYSGGIIARIPTLIEATDANISNIKVSNIKVNGRSYARRCSWSRIY